MERHKRNKNDDPSRSDDPSRMFSRFPHQNQDQVPVSSKITYSKYGKKQPISEQTKGEKIIFKIYLHIIIQKVLDSHIPPQHQIIILILLPSIIVHFIQ